MGSIDNQPACPHCGRQWVFIGNILRMCWFCEELTAFGYLPTAHGELLYCSWKIPIKPPFECVVTARTTPKYFTEERVKQLEEQLEKRHKKREKSQDR